MFKVAVLSNFTCDTVEEYLQVALKGRDIQAEVYLAGFNQIAEKVLNDQSDLYSSNPDLILLLLDEHVVLERMPTPWIASRHLKEAVAESISFLKQIVTRLTRKTNALVVINTIPVSENLLNTVIDYRSKALVSFCFNQLNQEIIQASLENKQVLSIDTAVLLQNEKVEQLRDERLSLYASMHFHDSLLCQLSHELGKIIAARLGLSKKCLVLDLDNTLWGGIIGDDGVEGIALGGSYEGYSYKKLQQVIKQLKAQGVLLAINSKNELTNVTEVFSKHPEMILSLTDFVSIKANWQPKNQNMQEIKQQLNIGLDSVVFVDDNPAECELINKYMPEVLTINLSEDPSFYIQELTQGGLFNKIETTEEDLFRTDDYQAEAKRKDLSQNYQNIEEYLHDLAIHLRIFKPNETEVSRISQLALRTNQFNFTGVRYSQQEVERLLASKSWLVLGIETEDRFGKNGIVGAVFIEIKNEHLYIRNFLLSCRVFSREIEVTLLSKLLQFAKENHFKAVVGEYVPSPKNGIIQDFYLKNGFDRDEAGASTQQFRHSLDKLIPVPAWINITSCVLENGNV